MGVVVRRYIDSLKKSFLLLFQYFLGIKFYALNNFFAAV